VAQIHTTQLRHRMLSRAKSRRPMNASLAFGADRQSSWWLRVAEAFSGSPLTHTPDLIMVLISFFGGRE